MAPLPPQARILAAAYKKVTNHSSSKFTGTKPSTMLYLGLSCIALLKDLLDFTGVGSFPGIGTVVTICFSFLIWMLMTLFDRSGGKNSTKMARGLVLMFFSLVEAVGFGLNFLPLETFTVVILYMMARSAWKKEQKQLEAEGTARTNAERIREYQMARAAAAFQETEAANNAQYQQEAGGSIDSGVGSSMMSGMKSFRESNGITPSPKMMDGAQIFPAQVRGRAANDSEYTAQQSVPQQAVSGSDIAPIYRPMQTSESSSPQGVTPVAAVPLSSIYSGSAPSFQTSSSPTPSGSSGVVSSLPNVVVSSPLPGGSSEREAPSPFSLGSLKRDEYPLIDFPKILPQTIPEFERALSSIKKRDTAPFEPAYEGQKRPKSWDKTKMELLGFSEEEIQQLVSASEEGTLGEALSERLRQEEGDVNALFSDQRFKDGLSRCENILSVMTGKAGTSYADIAPKALHLGKTGLAIAEINMGGELPYHYLGRYLPGANSVIVLHPEGSDPDRALHIRVHETLHALSYNPDRGTEDVTDVKEDDLSKTAGVTRDSKKLGMILNPLNEGITEYFAQKIVKQAGIKFTEGDGGDYQNYVSSVNVLIEAISRETGRSREDVEDEIFAAYSKKTGVLHIGKLLERHVGPGALRMMNMVPGNFSNFIQVLEQYKSGKTDEKFSLDVSTLEKSGTTAEKIIGQFPFVQFTKSVYKEDVDGSHFEKEVVYSQETLQSSGSEKGNI